MIPEGLIAQAAAIIGKRPVGTSIVAGRTAALRFCISFEGGSSVFIKAATSADTAAWLRVEEEAYRTLAGGTFLPEFFGSGEHDGLPFLLLEDLSAAHWPPPWSAAHIDAVLTALSEIHSIRGPYVNQRTPFDAGEGKTLLWDGVAADPRPFLSLGYCSESWLNSALPTLLAASAAAPLSGNSLLHLDVRSDNLCIRPDGRAALIDWNWVCRGNATMDIAGWLPSLHSEGGPLPETILPDAGPFAAWLSGFWAQNAGLPIIPSAPGVRALQQKVLRSALPWAVRALSLPPLDGTSL